MNTFKKFTGIHFSNKQRGSHPPQALWHAPEYAPPEPQP